MKIKTTRFGEIDIEADHIVHMVKGMVGMPEMRRFIIFQHQEDSPFYWYQSVDEPDLAFVVTNPALFLPEYKVDFKAVIKEMAWKNGSAKDHLAVYVVVNIPRGVPNQMTANLIGPLLINTDARQAVQVVLSDSTYSHQHPLLTQTESAQKKSA